MLLIHLSDIHFRKGEAGTEMDPNSHLRNKLLTDAEEMCKRIGHKPSAILITGDLTFAGDPEEFAFAKEWLISFCDSCGTDLKSVFVVPGNHDAVRKTSSSPVIHSLHQNIKGTNSINCDETIRRLLSDADAGRLLYDSLSNYNEFAANFFCSLLPPKRTIARRDLELNDGSILRISGLNSTFVSSADDKVGDLFVDPAAFAITSEKGVEHIVLCHHPYNWLRQGVELKDHLDDVARIQLFGHEHTNRIDLGRDSVRVSASAAHPERHDPGWEPGYNLVELTVLNEEANRTLEVRTHVRVWQQRPGIFRAKNDKNEEDFFLHTISLDAWTKPKVESIDEPQTSATDHSVYPEPLQVDKMDSLRDISVRFFKLTLNQKSAIAGKLELLDDDDINQPNFERFRLVLIRARQKGLIEELDCEIKNYEA